MNALTLEGLEELARLRGATRVRVLEAPPCQACGTPRAGLVHVWTDLEPARRAQLEASIERLRPIAVWVLHTPAEVVDPVNCPACRRAGAELDRRRYRRLVVTGLVLGAALASALTGAALWWGR